LGKVVRNNETVMITIAWEALAWRAFSMGK
jgi:hypothetical protein